MASPIYLAKLKIPMTEKPTVDWNLENMKVYSDLFAIQNTVRQILYDFVEEAPVDGESYVRKDGTWAVGSSGGGGIPDAPSDGKTYGRKNATWVEITGGAANTLTVSGYAYITDANATSATIRIPPLARVGDLLIITGFVRSSITLPAGWVVNASQANPINGQFQFVATKVAVAGDPGSNVTVSQAVSGRMGLTVLSVTNAVLGPITSGVSNSPPTVNPGPAPNKGLYILSLGVYSQTAPGNISCSNLIQLTPTSLDPLRNATAVKYVESLETVSSAVTTGGTDCTWLNIFLGIKP